MIHRLLATAIFLLFMPGMALASGAPDIPSIEMLDYLGSFETAGGKGIDPLRLDEEAGPQTAVKKRASLKAAQEKPALKKDGQKSEDGNDE